VWQWNGIDTQSEADEDEPDVTYTFGSNANIAQFYKNQLDKDYNDCDGVQPMALALP
jgi:hypothetical protein